MYSHLCAYRLGTLWGLLIFSEPVFVTLEITWDIIYSSKLCLHMPRESCWQSRTQWDHLKILQQLTKQNFKGKGRLIWDLSNLESVWLGIFTQKHVVTAILFLGTGESSLDGVCVFGADFGLSWLRVECWEALPSRKGMKWDSVDWAISKQRTLWPWRI